MFFSTVGGLLYRQEIKNNKMPIGGVHGDRVLYGPVGHPQNTTALLDTIAKLKQDIAQCHTEKHTLAEQMNVLITLVKR